MNKLPPGKYPLLPVIVLPRGAWSQGAAAGQCRAGGGRMAGWGLQAPWAAQLQAAGCTRPGVPPQPHGAAEASLLLDECRHRVWGSPSATNTPRSPPDLPAARQSTGHRRF